MPAKKRKLIDAPHCPPGPEGSVTSKHLENRGCKKRVKLRPQAQMVDVQLISPENQDDYGPGRIVTFNIQTGSYALRFLNNCLQIRLKPSFKNENYDGSEEFKDDDVKSQQWLGFTPFEAKGTGNDKNKNRALYFNPITGGPACLIAETETYFDNQLVQSNREGFISITQTLNRLFLPAHKRRKVCGHPHILHNDLNTIGHKTADPATSPIPMPIGPGNRAYDPAYYYALDQVNTGIRGVDGKDIIIQSNLDGIFPMSQPRNLTIEQIYDCEDTAGLNQLPLIPPQTEITLRLRLNDPLFFRMIDSNCPTKKYFGEKDPNIPTGNETFPWDDVKFEIKDIHLLVEKIRWKDEKIQRQLSTGGVNYHFDQYIFRSKALVCGLSNPPFKMPLPPNTQLVYFAIMRNCQLYKDTNGVRGSDGTRFTFPERLYKMLFRLDGQVILFENGLEMNKNDARSQKDSGLFYQYMRARGFTDDEKETFWPGTPNTIGYKQCFPIDLSPYCLTEASQLSIETWWSGKGVPPDLYGCLFIPQSVHISKEAGSPIWKSTATIS